MKRLILLFNLLLLYLTSLSQDWTEMMLKPDGKNFYEIQAAFNEYWKDKDINVPGNGYKPFKRWEYFMEKRVYPSGNLSLPSNTWKNYQEFLESNPHGKSAAAVGTWTAIGPMGPMTGVATNGFPRKAGRDNFIAFHPTQANTFWAGAPAGGLWKTTNGGASWTTNTDYLSVIGCTDLAIDPSNPSIMYLATGDGYGEDTYCIGVLKSTDGGQTWNSTGLTFTVSQQREMRRLLINPSNPQVLIAATNVGIYRTTNGGTSWTLVNGANTFDLEFKPGDPNTVYAGGTAFYLSTNGGASFTIVNSGIPTSGSNRMALAVTPDDPSYVYVLASNASTNGFLGLYRSTNSGVSFSTMSTSPDVLANSCSGSSGGGQGWYDLCIAVSPSDKNKVNVGGVNVWSSNSGGATGTWTCIGCWIGTTAPAVYLKADHHDLEYGPNGVLYSATDGGIFSYNTTNWIDLNPQRNIAQIYKIGLSSLSANRWITGHQDNGSNIYTGTTYTASMAGDGMDCFIDRTNDLNMFASTPNGGFSRSTTGGTSWNNATSGMSGSAGWVAPWKQDPQVATRLYAGRSQMFVSNNLGASWTALSSTGGSGQIVEFAIAPSNNQVIYVIHGTTIRKTTDGGSSWTSVTGTLPVGSAAPTFITISPTDPNKAWVTFSGYSSGNKVYQTVNGGSTWTNVSYNLPNLPANCSVYQPGTNDIVYVGMDVGVYYKDNSMTSWTLFNTNLPNAPISDMEISPASPGKLRASTYGRGVYETETVVAAAAIPVSNFTFSNSICQGVNVTFKDVSSNLPTSWSWSSNPSAGVIITSSNSQNPTFNFTSAGIYTVTMVASNTLGSGAPSNQTVNIKASPALNITMPNDTVCLGDDVILTASGATSYTWLPVFVGGPTVAVNTSSLQTITFTCNALGSNGCRNSQVINIEVLECVGIKDITGNKDLFSVFPNPATNRISIRAENKTSSEAKLQVFDASGKEVMNQVLVFKKEKTEISLNISHLANGVYTLKLSNDKSSVYTAKLVKE